MPCPVDGCVWSLNADIPLPVKLSVPAFLDGSMQVDPFAAVAAMINAVAVERAELIDAMLREHLESHDVMDWLKTVQRLRMDLAQFGSGIRSHRHPQFRGGYDEGPGA